MIYILCQHPLRPDNSRKPFTQNPIVRTDRVEDSTRESKQLERHCCLVLLDYFEAGIEVLLSWRGLELSFLGGTRLYRGSITARDLGIKLEEFSTVPLEESEVECVHRIYDSISNRIPVRKLQEGRPP